MVISFMDKEELFGGGDSERDEFTTWLVISEDLEYIRILLCVRCPGEVTVKFVPSK